MPLTSAHAGTAAKALVCIFFQHTYSPSILWSDLGLNFVAALLHELAALFEINLENASLNHPETIIVAERSHSPLGRTLKLFTEEKLITWYNYVDLPTFFHNTS